MVEKDINIVLWRKFAFNWWNRL